MEKQHIVFIVKREYDNLGIGYMSALLKESGYKTDIIDVCEKKKKIYKKLILLNPLIVGFSVIYQYHINLYADLIGYLKSHGLRSHLTAGGHYASLRYKELLELIPELDSVVRFEGEYTIRDLADSLSKGSDWKKVESLVYKNDGKIISTPLRSLEKNLDRFPFPKRSKLKEYAFDKKFATIIAGRGCVYNCSFCNLKEFYRPFPESVKRVRKPEMVAEEMEYLYRKKKCSVFLFQDDDFPVTTLKKPDWIQRFCSELNSRGLSEKIMWKINCRPDEIEEKLFALMKKNGLFLVFTGIEDGTDDGLKRLNKHMSVAECLRGINILKKLDLGFDFGFMLFQPSTTFKTLNENLDFLKTICGDGYSPVTYLKMMPYYETRIEKELLEEGRIKGAPGFRDYDFTDDSMNHYFEFITDCFMEWMRYSDGLANISKWARNYLSVCSRFMEVTPALRAAEGDLVNIISESNLFFIGKMKNLARIFETRKSGSDNMKTLKTFRKEIKLQHERYKKHINSTISSLMILADVQSRRQPSMKRLIKKDV
jgi:anaerobic magnesium-protoporphyrin IX monomethyl ester cyclase